MSEQYDDLQASYGRCLREKNFIARFYELFLASHPAIPPMFANTDFQQQQMALRRGISVAISHAAGSGLVTRTVNQMADVHGRSGRTPVPPHLYGFWLESLITAIRETDPQVSETLLKRWRDAMTIVIKTFSAHY
jgi:hemoglobin-like flavoprotein